MLFTHNVKKIIGAAYKNCDVDGKCKQTLIRGSVIYNIDKWGFVYVINNYYACTHIDTSINYLWTWMNVWKLHGEVENNILKNTTLTKWDVYNRKKELVERCYWVCDNFETYQCKLSEGHGGNWIGNVFLSYEEVQTERTCTTLSFRELILDIYHMCHFFSYITYDYLRVQLRRLKMGKGGEGGGV